jgi:hypothetical protein
MSCKWRFQFGHRVSRITFVDRTVVHSIRNLLLVLGGPGVTATWLVAEPSAAELLKLHVAEAASYRIYRDEAHKDSLELREKPIFNWTNVAGQQHTQYGHLFLWLKDGRPEVIGTIFSTRAPEASKRILIHEFHTLSPQRLFPVTPVNSTFQWKPEKGISLVAAADAPAVADSAAQRLVQMRNLARTYEAETRNREGKTYRLRLLTTPLWRYEPRAGDVYDGALFAMVSSEGTDPELVLIVEARHPAPSDASWSWHTAAVRFSDKDLVVSRADKLLWSSVDDPAYRAEINSQYTLIETRDKTYSCYRSRVIDELPAAEK